MSSKRKRIQDPAQTKTHKHIRDSIQKKQKTHLQPDDCSCPVLAPISEEKLQCAIELHLIRELAQIVRQYLCVVQSIRPALGHGRVYDLRIVQGDEYVATGSVLDARTLRVSGIVMGPNHHNALGQQHGCLSCKCYRLLHRIQTNHYLIDISDPPKYERSAEFFVEPDRTHICVDLGQIRTQYVCQRNQFLDVPVFKWMVWCSQIVFNRFYFLTAVGDLWGLYSEMNGCEMDSFQKIAHLQDFVDPGVGHYHHWFDVDRGLMCIATEKEGVFALYTIFVGVSPPHPR
jgi:hypothetical protein